MTYQPVSTDDYGAPAFNPYASYAVDPNLYTAPAYHATTAPAYILSTEHQQTRGYPSGELGNMAQPTLTQATMTVMRTYANPRPTNVWSNDLCNGCGTCGLCCYAWWCLPCLVNENSHRLDGGGDESCVSCCYPGNPLKNRYQAKKIYGIRETNCETCCTVCCCACCSEMQISEELTSKINTVPSYATV